MQSLVLSTEPPQQGDPCDPNPCDDDDDDATCRVVNGIALCIPSEPDEPRRECSTNAECARHLACIGFRCVDPCPGSCGSGARCDVINHVPRCHCPAGTTGNPVRYCAPVPASSKRLPTPSSQVHLCQLPPGRPRPGPACTLACL